MAGSSVDLQEVWNNRVPALVVLLSFTMQVTLLVTAEFRRRVDKAWLRVLVWSAYMLADWAAIYALGHLSVAANGPGQGQHHLKLLWAPFMLVHLGGQDNITAYALEDNRLWLRHLQALAVQAAAAAYVIYLSWSSSSVGGGGDGAVLRFRQASVVLYVVGILKYGERVAALWGASSSRHGKNYLSHVYFPTERRLRKFFIIDEWLTAHVTHLRGEAQAERKLLLVAHRLLDVCKKLILQDNISFSLGVAQEMQANELYKVAERQLSLMHDVLYTKAPVIMDSMCGFSIRIVSGAGTAAAFVLFHQGLMQVLMRHGDYCGRRHCSRADVAVTYVLLVGALVLEGLSMVVTVCSIWTEMASDLVRCAKKLLTRATPPRLLSCVVRVFQRRHYWSGTMGQLNLLELCVRSRSNRWSKGAKFLRLEEWWNTMVYSGSARVTEPVEDLVMELAAHLNAGHLYVDAATIGRWYAEPGSSFFESSLQRGALLEALGLSDESGDVQKLSLVGSCNMDETILVWHIATDIYLRALDADRQKLPLAKAVQALCNYMLFLLAARPGMLPASANRYRYVEMCCCLINVECAPSSPQGLAAILLDHGSKLEEEAQALEEEAQALEEEEAAQAELPCRRWNSLEGEAIRKNVALKNGCWLGAKLHQQHDADADGGGRILKIVAQVWAEILCYAGHRCSGSSHAERLSDGGELVTVAAIVMEHVETGSYSAFNQGPANTIETHV